MDNEKADGASVLLRKIAFAALILGALGSLGLMYYAGRKNESVILLLLFAGWDLSPFAGLVGILFFKRWPDTLVKRFYVLSLIIAVCSLIAYSRILTIPGTHNAFMFLVFPALSWLLIIATYLITQFASRKE